ncbi:MAG: hypothetical protein MI724_10310 [Spirochaetales bacterium]|nr:hypothetical protein [Spirochaetales bacterium]
MNNGRTIRCMSVALCAVALLACRTTGPVSPALDPVEASVNAVPSGAVESPPELSLGPHHVFEGEAAPSGGALTAPTPFRPEPSLEPPRPADVSFTTVLAFPRVASTVVAVERGTTGRPDGALARVSATPDSIDTSPGSALSPRGADEEPAAVGPRETRVTVPRNDPTVATVDTDRDPSPVPRIDRNAAGVGNGRTERADAAPITEEAPSGNGMALADPAVSGTPPTNLRTREEAFPVSQDTETTRNVRPGDLFVVQLPGPSWIFVGPTEGVEFLDRRAVANGVEFVFRLRESEDGRPVALRFESQDLSDGRRRTHTETIESSDGIRLVDRDIPTDGEALRGSGSESDAAERSPAAASSLSEGDVAPATEAIVAALESGEFNTLGVSEEELRDRVVLLGERAEHDSKARLLEAMLGAGVLEGDWILYTSAQLFESPWEGRDIRRARALYRRLVDEYPFSLHWDAARERIEFLNRHFFYIR